jgi:hypothetical protein
VRSKITLGAAGWKLLRRCCWVGGNGFVDASFRGDKKLADFTLMRFCPEARRAVDAWLQTDRFNNPNAPVVPFAMGEYAQPEREAAKRAVEEQARMAAAAQQANHSSDEYVLLTVRFAAVHFTLSTIVLATLPICRE